MRREKSAQLKLTKAKNAQPSQRTTTKNRFMEIVMNVGKVFVLPTLQSCQNV